jgi:hypothetical protein
MEICTFSRPTNNILTALKILAVAPHLVRMGWRGGSKLWLLSLRCDDDFVKEL